MLKTEHSYTKLPEDDSQRSGNPGKPVKKPGIPQKVFKTLGLRLSTFTCSTC